jgi:hypothetical protein
VTENLKRELLITRISDGYIQECIDVTGWAEEQIQIRMGSILSNPDFDFQKWLIRDSGWKAE